MIDPFFSRILLALLYLFVAAYVAVKTENVCTIPGRVGLLWPLFAVLILSDYLNRIRKLK